MAFFDFQFGFRSSCLPADFLTVVCGRIAGGFNRSGAARAVTLDICKAPGRVWFAGILFKLKSYGISGRIFGHLISLLLKKYSFQ